MILAVACDKLLIALRVLHKKIIIILAFIIIFSWK